MAISTFELFSIGIGPSSSHTVGPMRAAVMFVQQLKAGGLLPQTHSVLVQLYGSLGATGKGHGSDKAVLGGLVGHAPESVDPDELAKIVADVETNGKINLLGEHEIDFDIKQHLEFSGVVLDFHSNGLRITAYDQQQQPLLAKTYFSVGGGFVVDEAATGTDRIVADATNVEFPFSTGGELLAICEREGLSISTVMLRNELAWRDEATVRSSIRELWDVMKSCVERGCHQEGILPGGLKVKRRAAHMHRVLQAER